MTDARAASAGRPKDARAASAGRPKDARAASAGRPKEAVPPLDDGEVVVDEPGEPRAAAG